jgi:hypothetical protein
MMARVPFTRRSLLQAGLVIPTIAVVDACSSSKPHPAVPSATPSASASASGGPTATSLTTFDQTLLRGPAGTGGFAT